MDFESIGLPRDRAEILLRSLLPGRLVLLAGRTASGLSSTLAALIQGSGATEAVLFSDAKEFSNSEFLPVRVRSHTSHYEVLPTSGYGLAAFDDLRNHEGALALSRALDAGAKTAARLHADSFPVAIRRLEAFGIHEKDSLGKPLLSCVLRQVLAPRLCGGCRKPMGHGGDSAAVDLADAARRRFGSEIYEPGGGCPDCGGSGTRGHVLLSEIHEIRRNGEDILADVRSMADDAAAKMASGETSPLHILRAGAWPVPPGGSSHERLERLAETHRILDGCPDPVPAPNPELPVLSA